MRVQPIGKIQALEWVRQSSDIRLDSRDVLFAFQVSSEGSTRGIALGVIDVGQYRRVMVVTSEDVTKHMKPRFGSIESALGFTRPPSLKYWAHTIPVDVAFQFIDVHHRHHSRPHVKDVMYVLGAFDNTRLCAVAVITRPVSRHIATKNRATLEVTRLASDGTPNACSFLLSRCCALAKALGWSSLITYTLNTESGASLRGAGWRLQTTQAGNAKAWVRVRFKGDGSKSHKTGYRNIPALKCRWIKFL